MHIDHANLVLPADACPTCGERDVDRLVWIDSSGDDIVCCTMCGTEYDPRNPLKRTKGGDDEQP
jgi:hypothetical protein